MTASRRTPLTALAARRIVIIKPSALGDIVHSLPVLTALRRRFPDAHLAWVVNRVFEPLLRGHPDLDEVIAFNRGALRGGVVPGMVTYSRFLHELRSRCFDVVIDLQCLLRSGIMCLASGARRRVGLASAREGARWFYTDRVADVEKSLRDTSGSLRHAVDRYWSVAEAFGVGDGKKTFRVPIAADANAWAGDLLRDCPRPWLMVGVGSRWLTKRWPPGHFAELVRTAQEQFGGTAIFVGASDESELAQAALRGLTGPTRDLTGGTTLAQLAAVLQRADVMLANDTGPLHLAAALGRPVLAPYTCTLSALTGPYGQLDRGVETTVWCRGSYLKNCDRLECMAELTPARLWPLLSEILLTWQRHSRCA